MQVFKPLLSTTTSVYEINKLGGRGGAEFLTKITLCCLLVIRAQNYRCCYETYQVKTDKCKNKCLIFKSCEAIGTGTLSTFHKFRER